MLATFDDEVARRDAAVRSVESEIAGHERRISAANAEREAAYTELAEIYSADDGALAATFGDISRRLQQIFNEKMQRSAEVNALIDRAAALLAGLLAQIPAAQEAEHAGQARLDETRRAVEADLATDVAFQPLKREADDLLAATQQAVATHQRIGAECETKLAAFTAHRLFRYLVTVKYGTPDYRGRGLIAAGDRWVAERVAWHRNYPSFTILNELPGFAEKRVQSAQKKSDLAATAVTLHVQAREVALGVAAARASLAGAKLALTSLREQIAKTEAQRATLVEERRSIDTGRDPFRQRAKAEMKTFLAANPTSVLKAKAAATANPRDNELAEQVERAEYAINEGRKRVKRLVEERAEATSQHNRAVAARRKFSSDYTGSYDQFDTGIDVSSLLLGYIVGSTSERALWSSVDDHHHDATPTYSYSSSSGGHHSSGGFGGGGSSGGFSSGGGDSGGGFSTGGGD
ncbi:MAG: hypothetical protein RIQ79_2004 [Verrucomicrobiota bacterium]